MPRLAMLVLGPPRLERDGRPIELTLRRAMAAVIHLAMTGRPQTRETLAGLLWPEADDREARGRLRRALHRVTEALGPGLVQVDGDSLSIQAADLDVDARDFEQHAAAGLRAGTGEPGPGQIEHLRRAASLYADDFLAGFSVPDSSAWDEWQFLERERLRETMARVLDRLIEADGAAGSFERAVGYARRRLALDALHEPSHRALMTLYARSGQQAAALRQYAECRRVLASELGMEPEAATDDLYDAIRSRRLTTTASSPSRAEQAEPVQPAPTLPRPAVVEPARSGSDLLERAEPLARLGGLLQGATDGDGTLVLLGGEAGVGKTSLVRRLVEMAREGGGIRVLEGACDALSTPRALGPLADIAAVVGGEVERTLVEGGRRDAIFAAFLADLARSVAPTLVVFEDVHWADEATLDLLRFLGRRLAATRALLVATYRDDEVGPGHPLRIVMGDLATSAVRRVTLAPLSLDAVARLAAGYHLDPVALHRQTGGNPLFVTEVLTSTSNGETGIPPSVRDAVLARVGRLSADARAVLESAAVIDSRVDAALLADTHGPGFEAIDDCLAMGVLAADGDAWTFRHELSRQAVLQAMSPSRRLVLHRRVLAVLRSRPHGPNDLALLTHHADLAADPEAVLTFAPQAAERAASLGAHREAAAQYARALRFADRLLPEQRADLYDRRSYECFVIGQLADAIEARKAAVRIWRTLENRLKEGESLSWLSRLHWLIGHRSEADEADRLALSILETLPPGPQLAWAYSNRALLHLLANERRSAITWGGRAASLAGEFAQQEVRLHALTTVAVARILLDDETGWADLERCLREAEAGGLDDHVGRAFANLCSAAVFCWRFELAERYLDEGIAYCLDHDLDSHRLYLLSQRALLLHWQGLWAGACDAADAVLAQPHAHPIARIHALMALGRVRARRGETGPAEHLLDDALRLALAMGEVLRIGPVRAARAEAAWLRGDRDAARQEAQSGLALAMEHGHEALTAELALWLQHCGGLDEVPSGIAGPFARELTGGWSAAAQQWQELGCPYETALALLAGDASAVRRALKLFEDLGAPPGVALAKRRLAELEATGIRPGAS